MPFAKVSIIIIAESWNNFLEESLPYYEKLDYPNYETIVITTQDIGKRKEHYPHVRFIVSKETKNKPAEKRDLCMQYANGNIYAFIDDDAFPEKDWLKNAMKNFTSEKVAAIGGPGITPRSAGALEKASGWISASPVGGFGSTYRFIPQAKKKIDDFPTMNLLVRADDFKKIGGFDSNYYPGEDTKLCLDLTHKLGKEIIYDPEVIVYHHKRPLFKKHLLQNGRFGIHRGNFAKNLPETSKRWFYFIPSLFTTGLIVGSWLIALDVFIDSIFLSLLVKIYLYVVGFYLSLILLNALWIFLYSRSLAVAILTIPGVFLTHVWYGIKFIQGYFFSKKLNDRYGRSE